VAKGRDGKEQTEGRKEKAEGKYMDDDLSRCYLVRGYIKHGILALRWQV
jgi:hypothetical protein